MNSYDHKAIEAKWQKQWADASLFKTPETPNDKMYLLVEFPYPSGNLHVGHWYAFAVTDIFARYMHHVGKDVFFPIGFDSFGLPAENAAIKRGLNPKDWTYSNIDFMVGQIKSMGGMFDWDKRVVTSDPEYYKWTQWLFLQFYKKGLVQHEKTHVNWCPSCKTVLANEQLEGGVCERCGSAVEQKEMMQWNIEITKYADRLIDDLDTVQWPEHIKEAQKNWIGRSTGSFFDFPIADSEEKIKVFTTRADTLFGVTYVVLAPEHALVQKLKPQITNWSDVETYIQKANQKTDLERQANKEKTGVRLEGISVTHPATQEQVPVFISDYVLAHYGTGAVMAVPAHDERDYEFAQKFGLPVKTVVEPITGTPLENEEDRKSIVAYLEDPKTGKVLSINWGADLGGNLLIGGGREEGENPVECAKREILEETGYANVELIAQSERVHHHYRAHSKNVNRNIEAIGLHFRLVDDARVEQQLEENENGKFVIEWVEKNALESLIKDPLHGYLFKKFTHDTAHEGPGILTNSGDYDGLESSVAKEKITSTFGQTATTYKLQDWSVSRQRYWGCPIPMIHCQKCGTVPVAESDLPVKLPEMEKIEMRDDGKSPLAHNEEWMKVSCPACGGDAQRETDTLDTFVDSSWYYTRYADPKNVDAFASRESLATWMPVDFYSGGSEHTTRHLLYARFVYKVMHDLGLVPQSEPFIKRNNRGLILGPDGEKMSKSKGNVIDPDEIVERVGADVVRSYLAFMGPYGEAGNYPWDPNGVVGIRRFFERVVGLKEKISTRDSEESLLAINTLLKNIRTDFEQLKFNTGLSKIMICVNSLEKAEFSKHTFSQLLVVLNSYAPHLAQELWTETGHTGFIHSEAFPVADETVLAHQTVKIAVQINGKTRAVVECEPGSSKETIAALAKADPEVTRWLEGKEILKEVYVENRLLSLVTKG
jgi:leucyl-tRNA synthetase